MIPTQIYPWQQNIWQQLTQRAEQGILAHAYLFSGEAGIGKLRFAEAFAGYLLCQARTADAPCGVCKGCDLLSGGNHPDLHVLQPEEGSTVIKIEQVRQAGRFVQQTSHAFGSRVIILHPAEALGIASANALLKVLEEPPANTCFLVLSHQPGLLLPTVRSRCQALEMPLPDLALAREWLHAQHGASTDEDVISALHLSRGRPLAALDALKQNLPGMRRDLLVALAKIQKAAMLPTELAGRFDKSNLREALGMMLQALAALIRFQASGQEHWLSDGELRDLALLGQIDRTAGPPQAKRLHTLYRTLEEALKLLRSASNPNPQLLFETALIHWQQTLTPVPIRRSYAR